MTKRIQRKRTKGWRMPDGCTYVGRPTRYGNPFRADAYGLELCLNLFRQAMEGGWNPSLVKDLDDAAAKSVYMLHHQFKQRFSGQIPIECAKYELRGKDLACWCKVGKACHADILLEMAR